MNDFLKVRQVLLFLFLFSFIIFFRVWHLSVPQKEKFQKEAQRPQKRTLSLSANRGNLFDRYHLPLAINRIQYNASISYSLLQQIPLISWEKGERIPRFPRKEYIARLASFLGSELHLNPERIEDLIHSKASLYPHLPFLIAANLSEKQYFRMRMKEREWPGMHADIHFHRFYPAAKSASNILGFLGAISKEEHFRLLKEMRHLQKKIDTEELLPFSQENPSPEALRLQELKDRAYTLQDCIGKTGLEGKFEETLRGFRGKKVLMVDRKGNIIKELPESKTPLSGKKLISTISLELEQYAEALLAIAEKERSPSPFQNVENNKKSPWIKGGAIVVMDPNTGEILSLASYPRYNPNDFSSTSSSKNRLQQWLERPTFLANLWEGKEFLSRERYSLAKKEFYEEKQKLSISLFLDFLMPKNCPLRTAFHSSQTLQVAISLQEDMEKLLYFAKVEACFLMDFLFPKEEGHHFCSLLSSELKETLHKRLQEHGEDFVVAKQNLMNVLTSIPHNLDKLFFIDLCRTLVHSPSFSNELITKVKDKSLSSYWNFSQATLITEKKLKERMRPLFHALKFSSWKEKKQKSFLQKKRKEEKEKKRSPHPYIEYLDQKEQKLFEKFWKKHRLSFLLFWIKEEKAAISEELSLYFSSLSSLKGEEDPSFEELLLKEELASFEPSLAQEFLNTVRPFSSLDRTLLYPYASLKKEKGKSLERHLAISFYPSYGFGFGRSQAFQESFPLGSIFKLITSYAALKQNFLDLSQRSSFKKSSLFQALNPFTMIDRIEGSFVGFSPEGTPYPRFYKGGRLPISAHSPIGKVDLLSALEQSSNPYFSLLAGDFLHSPEDLIAAAQDFGLGEKTEIDLPGENPGFLPTDLEGNRTSLYSLAIGQHSLLATPLQVAVFLSAIANGGKIIKPEILKREHTSPTKYRQIFLPPEIRSLLLEGMGKVLWGEKGSARPNIIKKLRNDPKMLSHYLSFERHLVGKTSTVEFLFLPNILPSSSFTKHKHAWFGAISFKPSKEKWKKPELVIVVFLHFGESGKEAAPLATEILHKYRELCSRHGK